MIEVIPAILPENIDEVRDKMSFVNGIVNIVQIDVCDGRFVPSVSWPFKNDGGEFEKIIDEDEGFPFWNSLDFEVDLMVENPENVAEEWVRAGAKRLVLHIESSENILDVVKKLRGEYGYSGDNPLSIDIGLALNIETPNEELYEFLNTQANGRSLVDFVQFMGIREVGFQGQVFDDNVLGKIRELRSMFPEAIISVDGGVNTETAPQLIEAGVNRLISGSAVFDSADIKGAIDELGQAEKLTQKN